MMSRKSVGHQELNMMSFVGYLCLPIELLLIHQPVENGTLFEMPRGLRSRYRICRSFGENDGYFRPWKDLGGWSNLKRISGVSLRTIFVPGRRSTNDIRAEFEAR